ncbi:hypothetical protein HNY73_007319 [Argiope bruennichi]|uniref:Uncharacterized protein n=1 Tax=Argiope bruennichi TaxID=94029 RepID=A0A8T0FIM2_ARGBR|nr:hypothetical protein HNY73_007319 [Argiope bruennichi]
MSLRLSPGKRMPIISDHWYAPSSGRSFKRSSREKYRTTDNETEKKRDIASVIQEEVMEALAPITVQGETRRLPNVRSNRAPKARREITTAPLLNVKTDYGELIIMYPLWLSLRNAQGMC